MMNEKQIRTYRKELEWHVNEHPSERWKAKLETVNDILSGGSSASLKVSMVSCPRGYGHE